MSVDGRNRTVGLSFVETRKLIASTVALVSRQVVSGEDLSRIVGGWSWAFLCCRSAFSVFSAVYRFIVTAGKRPIRLWRSVVNELAIAVDLAPLLWSSLSLPVLPSVLCTDSSSSGQGVVIGSLQPDTVRSLAASSVSAALMALDSTRSPGMVDAVAHSVDTNVLRSTRELSAAVAPAGPFSLYFPSAPRFLPCTTTGAVGEQHFHANSLDPQLILNAVRLLTNERFAALHDSIAGDVKWRTVVSSRWRRCVDEHINSKELRAIETGIRSIVFGAQLLVPSRLLVFTDSTVALFALSKGRSSSPVLLRRTRAVAALLLATGIRPYYRYIPSALNPADRPSRFFASH